MEVKETLYENSTKFSGILFQPLFYCFLRFMVDFTEHQ